MADTTTTRYTDRTRAAHLAAHGHHPAVEMWLDGDPGGLLLMDPRRRAMALELSGHTADALDRWARQLGHADIEDMVMTPTTGGELYPPAYLAGARDDTDAVDAELVALGIIDAGGWYIEPPEADNLTALAELRPIGGVDMAAVDALMASIDAEVDA